MFIILMSIRDILAILILPAIEARIDVVVHVTALEDQ